MPTLDEFLNTSKDTTEFAGWLEVCIFLNTSNLRLIIVFCWIVFQALSVVKMQVCLIANYVQLSFYMHQSGGV